MHDSDERTKAVFHQFPNEIGDRGVTEGVGSL